MAYTNPWDETKPLDTSAANQLGDVVRDLKTDVHERLLLSGTFGERPTPEAVFVGMMFFATDTGQLFRWSGSAWIEISSTFIPRNFVDSSTVTLTNPAAPADGNSIVIPAGYLVVGCVIEAFAYHEKTVASANNPNIVLMFGAAVIAQNGAAIIASNYRETFHAQVYVIGAASHFSIGDNLSNVNNNNPTRAGAVENIAGAITIKTRMLSGDVGGTHVFNGLIVRVR